MEGFVPYIIKSLSILSLLYGYYWLFLRRQTFFTVNRFYLLISLLMGICLPFISIEITTTALAEGKFHPTIYMENLLTTVSINANDSETTGLSQSPVTTVLLAVYIVVALFFLVRYLIALIQILLLIWRNPHKTIQGIHIVKVRKPQPLFSFFNYMFIHTLPASKDDRRKIFEHEKKHIMQVHSVDLLFSEFICITNWFNPVVWLFKNAILENHEYIADRQVICRYHTGGYPELLVRQAFKGCFSFTNNFACSKLKKRIMMMTKKQTSKFQVIRYIPAFALTGFLFYGFCCNAPAKAAESIASEQVEIQDLRPQKDTSDVFSVVETVPQFIADKGGAHAWICKNLKYPSKAVDEKKEGRVVVTFVIEKDGSITDAKVLKKVSPELDAEALRVINAMPKWKPGVQRGQNVRVSYSIPVQFKIQDDQKPAKGNTLKAEQK